MQFSQLPKAYEPNLVPLLGVYENEEVRI